MKKSFKWIIFLMISTVVLAGCGASAATTEKDSNGDYNLIMTSAGTSSTFYVVGTSLAQNLNNYKDGIKMTNQASGGSVENIRLLDRKEAHFTIVGGDSAEGAYHGTHEFEGNPRGDSIRGVLNLYEQPLTLVVLEDSGINSFSDLKGKRVAVGPPGSGAEIKSREVLSILGLPYGEGVKQQHISFADAVESMKDNQTDAMFVWAGVPAPSVQELASARDIKIIEFTQEEVDKVSAANPSIFGLTVEGGKYKQAPEDYLTLGNNTQIIARGDVPDEVVYLFLEGIFENLDEIQLTHEALKEISIDKADEDIINIHPGAKQFYEDWRSSNK